MCPISNEYVDIMEMLKVWLDIFERNDGYYENVPVIFPENKFENNGTTQSIGEENIAKLA